MKNEIKIRSIEQQAIDNLKAIINCEDKIIDIEPPLEDTAQILLDYITNLQEENKKQKNIIVKQNDRIKGAIECITNFWKKKSYYEDVDNCMKYANMNEWEKEDLLNILEGDDKE